MHLLLCKSSYLVLQTKETLRKLKEEKETFSVSYFRKILLKLEICGKQAPGKCN